MSTGNCASITPQFLIPVGVKVHGVGADMNQCRHHLVDVQVRDPIQDASVRQILAMQPLDAVLDPRV